MTIAHVCGIIASIRDLRCDDQLLEPEHKSVSSFSLLHPFASPTPASYQRAITFAQESRRKSNPEGETMMRIARIRGGIANIGIALAVMGGCTVLNAQSQCGWSTGPVCPSPCRGGPDGWAQGNQGPSFGTFQVINCGICGFIQVPITSNSGGCNNNGLGPQAILSITSSANGEQVLVAACGGGFEPLVEQPKAVAQNRWQFPTKPLPIFR